MSKELVVGKRYWLDVDKDVSAVFIGYGDDGKRHLFNNAQGSEKYQVIENGIIPFLKCPSGISEVVDINQELVTRLYNLVNAVDCRGVDPPASYDVLDIYMEEARETLKKVIQ